LENQYVGPHHRFPLFIWYVVTAIMIIMTTTKKCSPNSYLAGKKGKRTDDDLH
jgi:hypothetical protein